MTMMRKRPLRRLAADEIGSLIGLGAVVLGAGLYLYPPALAGFPINDGGLFYTMIRALQQNSYRLPDYISYNGLQIPFAYPPFALLTGAALSGVLQLDPLVILQWLPAIILIGISVAFYFLAARMLGSRIEAGIATFLYVCTPRSMTWLIMGGGLTRSLGQLFVILTTLNFHALLTDRRRGSLILSILFGSLAVVTHPEAALQTAAVCALIWVFHGRTKQGSLNAAVVVLGVAGASAIWWLPELARLGPAPFMSAAQTGLHAGILLVHPFLLTFTEEPAFTIIAAMGFIGIAACVLKRDYLLPIWVLLPFAVDPRGAANVAVMPLSMLGAIGIWEVVVPGLAGLGLSPRSQIEPGERPHRSRVWALLGGYLVAFLLIMGTYGGLQLAQVHLSRADATAFQWVASNLPPQSRFLIMTGTRDVFCDPVQEWFPALTPAVSETTIQGYEWASEGAFFGRVADLQDVQSCLSSDSALECVQSKAEAKGMRFDYIYLSRPIPTDVFCRPTGSAPPGTSIFSDLHQDSRYRSLYEAPGIEIFSAPH